MTTILTQDLGAVRTITLNRPERRNALTPEMQEELLVALHAAAFDASVRVLILTGAGEAFCAGLDLEVMKQFALSHAGDSSAVMALEEDARRIARIFRTLYELPKPTIARVQGHAIAGGTGLATMCDFTLAVPQAKFGYTEVRIGFVPALVSAYLSLQVGDKRARDLLLSGRLFSAEEARGLGLVTEVVAAEELDERVQTLAAQMVGNAPGSLRATKSLLAEMQRPALDAAIARALEVSAAVRQTADFREGITAFLEKRTPVWVG